MSGMASIEACFALALLSALTLLSPRFVATAAAAVMVVWIVRGVLSWIRRVTILDPRAETLGANHV